MYNTVLSMRSYAFKNPVADVKPASQPAIPLHSTLVME
jgi:hypothetical protein